jgi:N-acetyl-anhydromuramyl-L-alanine amidase AmpD
MGYHFVIGNGNGSGDGQIEPGSRWTAQAVGAHAASPGNQYNEQGVGICLVGNFTSMVEGGGLRLPTGKQIESLRFLVLYLCLKLGLTPDEMIGHCDVPGAHTLCPGGNLPLEGFRRELRRDFERLRRAAE